MFDDQVWTEIYYGRPHGWALATIDDLSAGGGGDIAIGFHLIVVERPLRVVGYRINGFNISPTAWRFWIHCSHRQCGLPYREAMDNSDTFDRNLVAPSGTKNRDTIMQAEIGPTPTDNLMFVDILLPNPVTIAKAGIYWVGMARDRTLESGETYLGSVIRPYSRGLRDLCSTESVAGVGDFSPGSLAEFDVDAPLDEQNFEFPGSEWTDLSLCNVDVGLLTTRWWNG
ncbi:MAG TPA: hypothetical protein PKA27_14400 [Fimbriimonadaceae bacterium]|nr:hypothetical protein [Fimbriimonadaceae bacterium]